MKRKFKLLTLVVTAAMMSSVFVGCGSKDDATSNDKSKDTVNLTLWEHDSNYAKADKEIVKLFEEKHPNIKIEIVDKGSQYDTLLSTAIQAGDAPDIFWSNGNKDTRLSSIVKIGGAMDLTDKIDISQYDPMAQSVLFLNDENGNKKLYCTPGGTIDTRAVFYHKDIFDKYGIKVPNNLAEFEAACETLKKNGVTPITQVAKDSWGILFSLEPIMSAVAPDWIDDAAAGKAKIDDPRVLKAFNKMQEWMDKGYFSANGLGSDQNAGLLNFSKQNSAMIICGSWVVPDILKNNPDVKLGAFQMPMESGGKASVISYSVGWAGYAKTKHPDEVLEYLKFATTLEAQQAFVNSINGIPSLKGVEAKEEITKEMAIADKKVDSFYSIIGYRPKDDASPRKLWEDDSTKWIGGKVTAEDLIKEIDEAQDYSKKITN
ncbi:ABC transporter substrate-binding protein [Clostridium diolis]|uniref:ABC transporter substrate-binding protein n=1 Tax=Clostridium diolis TaxID=223919 RepID=UPI003AF75874